MNGWPAASVVSRARNGSTAATPAVPSRNAIVSGGRSPTIPERPPASALIQRSERSVDSTQTRTVSRIEATVTIIASVIPSAIASAVTAMPLRASAPPKNPAARRPSAPRPRASSRPGSAAPSRTASGAASARARTTSATAAKPKQGKAVHGPGTRERDGRGQRHRGAERPRPEPPPRHAFDRARPHRRGGLDARGLDGRQDRGEDRRADADDGRQRPRRRRSRPRRCAPSAGRCSRPCLRRRATPPATRRARGPRRAAVPAMPIASPSARKAEKIAEREVPRARSVAISGRRRSTAIDTALAIRKIPTSSVSEPSAFRFRRNARTIRSAVCAARPGGSSARPRGRRRAISRPASDRDTPGSSTMSTRSTRPFLPSRSWAVKMSVTRMSPPEARARPESSRIPLIRARWRMPPATRASSDPGTRRWRSAKGTETNTPPVRERSSARAAGPAGSTSLTSRTAPSPPQSIPRTCATSRLPSSRIADPVTAGANDPIGQRKERAASSPTGIPAAPVTTKSLLPATAAAASWNEAVTLRLAWWIAATAATPIATPIVGRRTRIGCRRAGPVIRARKTREKPLTRRSVRP